MIAANHEQFAAALEWSRSFVLPGVTVTLSSDRPEQIDLANHYFAPYAHQASRAGCDFKVRAVHDSAAARTWLATVRQLPGGANVDHHPDTAYLEKWRDDQSRLLVSVRGLAHAILIRRGRDYLVFTEQADAVEVLKPAIRVIRELFIRTAESRDSTLFHASSAVLDDKALLFVADGMSGKTSLALAVARAPGGSFVASDRTAVRRSSEGFAVLAWPGGINVGIGTCRATRNDLDWWKRLLPTVTNAYFFERGCPDEFRDDEKFCLTPREAETHLGVSFLAEAALSTLVFPALTRSTGYSARKLTPAEVRSRLLAQLRSGCDEIYTHGIAEVPDRVPERMRSSALDLIDRLAETTPGHALELSREAVGDLLRGALDIRDMVEC